jgi:hypothetical protein
MRNLKIACALCAALLCNSATAQSPEEIALFQATFAQLQPTSFEDRREYCGYVGINDAGELTISGVARGRRNSCLADDPDDLAVIYASFHTHGAFRGEEGDEVPSVSDIEADADEGIDGYVATPGGRLWYIDTEDMVTYQICGRGCLPQDPSFQPFPGGLISESYSYDALVSYFE